MAGFQVSTEVEDEQPLIRGGAVPPDEGHRGKPAFGQTVLLFPVQP